VVDVPQPTLLVAALDDRVRKVGRAAKEAANAVSVTALQPAPKDPPRKTADVPVGGAIINSAAVQTKHQH